MPRPKRPRCIRSRPIIKEFRPVGVEERGEVALSLEEFEAIRHIDFEGLDQSQAAEIMNVSRQTFGRILKAGRFNLSKALVNAYRLKIEGGCYMLHGNGRGYGRHGHGKGNRRRGRGNKN
ncbi:DUF134 domain-containing protein [Desulfobacula sp.]|uniref:DUF134 domain-containing protein n=1 Tax=Desulfobacula sp. TaxID=2593537 RepID=UPI002606BD2E|nr:DUF134 domain-containing protein [Desulfobacula sp.]